MRDIAAIFLAVFGLCVFGFALHSTGLQFISDCSTPVRGPAWGVWGGAAVFVLLSALACWLQPKMAFLFLIGTGGLLLFHDFVQGQTTADVLKFACKQTIIR